MPTHEHNQDERAQVGGPVDETSVCVAIYGANLDPEKISERLACAPTHAHRRGDRQSPTAAPYESGAWILQITGPEQTDPEYLIRQLFMRLPADPSVWEGLSTQFDVQLRLGLHFTGWNKGFGLSSEVVAAIGQRGARMEFDLYGYGEGDV
jgi:hypothetical protein